MIVSTLHLTPLASSWWAGAVLYGSRAAPAHQLPNPQYRRTREWTSHHLRWSPQAGGSRVPSKTRGLREPHQTHPQAEALPHSHYHYRRVLSCWHLQPLLGQVPPPSSSMSAPLMPALPSIFPSRPPPALSHPETGAGGDAGRASTVESLESLTDSYCRPETTEF
jgi:hypothetical protein